MSNRKIIVLNTLSQIVGKIITSGTMFLVSIIIARALGAQGYGDYIKISTFVAFFYLLSDFGLNTAYLELSDQKKSEGSLLALRMFIGLALMFLCISILSFLPGTSTDGYTPLVKLCIILFSGSILFQSLITTGNAFFQKKLRYDLSTLASFAGSIFTFAFTMFFFLRGSSNLVVFTLIGLFSYGIIAGVSLFLAKKTTPTLSFSFDRSLIKKYLRIAFPLGLTLLCNLVYFRTDSIILTVTKSTADVGIYGLAYKVFEFFLVVPTFFMNAVYPLLLQSISTQDMKAFLRQLKQSFFSLFILSLFLTLGGLIASPLLPFIKSDFIASILPLRILLLSLPIFYLTSITMWVLIALKKRSVLFFIYFFSMCINIGLNILLVPRHGYIAAAWITVVSEAIVLILSFLSIQRNVNFKSENRV